MLIPLVQAAWRHKRVLTDPDVAVLLDAIEERSPEQVRTIVAASGGRITVERPRTEGFTAVLWNCSGRLITRDPGETDEELRARIKIERDREAREDRVPLAVVACTEVARDSPLAGVGPVTRRVFDLGEVTFERGGLCVLIEIYDERGVLITSHQPVPSYAVAPGEKRRLRDITCRDEHTARFRARREELATHMRAHYGDTIDLNGTFLGHMLDAITRQFLDIEGRVLDMTFDEGRATFQARAQLDRVVVEGTVEF